jgi:hypothetical protein
MVVTPCRHDIELDVRLRLGGARRFRHGRGVVGEAGFLDVLDGVRVGAAGVSRSRMVMRRWDRARMPGTRCGTIRSPAEPSASVVSAEMIALTATLTRPLPPDLPRRTP